MQQKNSNVIIDGANKIIDLRQQKNGMLILRLINLAVWIVFAVVVYHMYYLKNVEGVEDTKAVFKTFSMFVLAFPMYVALAFDFITFLLVAYAEVFHKPLKVGNTVICLKSSHIYALVMPFVTFAGRHIMAVRTFFLYKIKDILQRI